MPDLESDSSTRERILRLVIETGPVAVHDLADALGLTTAGVRRHVAALEGGGEVTVHGGSPRRGGRGRPARRYVATDRARAALDSSYADLAVEVLDHLAAVAGPQSVEEFARNRAARLANQLRPALVGVGDLAERVERTADVLSSFGYAASVRAAPSGRAVQLCQGHCPVLDVAVRRPVLCEAETSMLADVLGVPVQRLSTIAAGAHVCTTHVSLTASQRRAGSTSTRARTTSSDRPIDHRDSRPPAALEAER